MVRTIVAYLATFLVFLSIDLVWLGVIASGFYRDALGERMEVDLAVALAFYALYVTGVLIFAVLPADRRGDLRQAALWGGLFGFYCYATYDLTNLATLKDWPWIVAAVDIPWGVFLTGSSALAGAAITRALLGPRAAE